MQISNRLFVSHFVLRNLANLKHRYVVMLGCNSYMRTLGTGFVIKGDSNFIMFCFVALSMYCVKLKVNTIVAPRRMGWFVSY